MPFAGLLVGIALLFLVLARCRSSGCGAQTFCGGGIFRHGTRNLLCHFALCNGIHWAVFCAGSAYAAGQTEEDVIQRQFLSYQDEDGFHYLQFWQDCSGGQPFRWTYYPPREYKLLLYFPEQNQFVCSEIYQRYAFDSYYQLDAAGEKLSAMLTSGSIASADFSKHYDYTTEIWSLLARIVLTILLEMLLALCFGFRGKKQLALLAGVNIATQVGLNVALNIVNYYQGQMAFVLLYFALELLICLVEALVYAKWLGSLGADGQKHTAKTVASAILANVFSFGAGMALAYYLPGIF